MFSGWLRRLNTSRWLCDAGPYCVAAPGNGCRRHSSGTWDEKCTKNLWKINSKSTKNQRRIYERSMKHNEKSTKNLWKINENVWKLYERSTKNVRKIKENSIKHLWKPNTNLQKIYRKSMKNVRKIYETSTNKLRKIT